jgi:hypothetical protein
MGGSLYGGSIRNSNGNAFGGGGGFGMFGPLMIPPPPPASREPPRIMQLPQKHEKLLPSNPNAWKPGRMKQHAKEETEPKSEEELIIEVNFTIKVLFLVS